jgi:uncharacterized protein (TIGR02996 family)
MCPDERAFLDAVLASPDDDLPRLVYADWLEERRRGDRAAMIRRGIASGGEWRADNMSRLLPSGNGLGVHSRHLTDRWTRRNVGFPRRRASSATSASALPPTRCPCAAARWSCGAGSSVTSSSRGSGGGPTGKRRPRPLPRSAQHERRHGKRNRATSVPSAPDGLVRLTDSPLDTEVADVLAETRWHRTQCVAVARRAVRAAGQLVSQRAQRSGRSPSPLPTAARG